MKKGDKVYFGENATEEERFMGHFKGGLLFSVRVDEIQAVVRETKIFTGMKPQPRIYMQGGWVLVKLDMETWEEIISPWGVIFKAAPTASEVWTLTQTSIPRKYVFVVIFLYEG